MNKRIANIVILAALVAGACGWALAQAKEEPPDRAVVPLTNPAKPAKIEVSVMRGDITIKAYEGRDVIVEARTRERALSQARGVEGGVVGGVMGGVVGGTPVPAVRTRPIEEEVTRSLKAHEPHDARREEKEKKTAGMKVLSGSTSGLEIEEEDNVVQISTQSMRAAMDLVIQVPAMTSLEIGSSMGGAVLVEGVSGELDINNVNGPVTLKNVSGNTLVHTVTGDIEASLVRVTADKPLSFSSMTGDIDVTLPADIKASLKMKSEMGEIYTDFDITMTKQPARTEASGRSEEGRFRITFDKSLYGLVNGGGPEITFNTHSGDIYIRKRK